MNTTTPPNGYHKLPDGVRCRCIGQWSDGLGGFWCCRPHTADTQAVENLRRDNPQLAVADLDRLTEKHLCLALGSAVTELMPHIDHAFHVEDHGMRVANIEKWAKLERVKKLLALTTQHKNDATKSITGAEPLATPPGEGDKC